MIRRVTGTPRGGYEYSQLQAFAHDNGYVMLIEGPSEDDASLVIRRWPSLEVALDDGATAHWNVPRWHPVDWATIIHFDSNADEVLRLQFTDISTGETETVFTFPPNYQGIRGNQSFDEISRTDEWLAGLATTGLGQVIFTFNLVTRELGAEIDFDALYAGVCTLDPQYGAIDPDWVGVSPLGRYLVVQWPTDGTGRCEGLETFDIRSGAYVGHISSGHAHGDLAVLADGETEVFVTTELSGPTGGESYVTGTPADGDFDSNYPGISYRALPGLATGEQTPTYLYLTDWIIEHISCPGPFGWCLGPPTSTRPTATTTRWRESCSCSGWTAPRSCGWLSIAPAAKAIGSSRGPAFRTTGGTSSSIRTGTRKGHSARHRPT